MNRMEHEVEMVVGNLPEFQEQWKSAMGQLGQRKNLKDKLLRDWDSFVRSEYERISHNPQQYGTFHSVAVKINQHLRSGANTEEPPQEMGLLDQYYDKLIQNPSGCCPLFLIVAIPATLYLFFS